MHSRCRAGGTPARSHAPCCSCVRLASAGSCSCAASPPPSRRTGTASGGGGGGGAGDRPRRRERLVLRLVLRQASLPLMVPPGSSLLALLTTAWGSELASRPDRERGPRRPAQARRGGRQSSGQCSKGLSKLVGRAWGLGFYVPKWVQRLTHAAGRSLGSAEAPLGCTARPRAAAWRRGYRLRPLAP